MSYLGWYGSDGNCWCYVRIQDGARDAAILRLMEKLLEGSDMYIMELDKRPTVKRGKEVPHE
jgi:hypothetical protein